MKLLFLVCVFSQISVTLSAQGKETLPEVQIKLALLAAPSDKKEMASVYGYNKSKELIVLRTGSNELFCIADDPEQPGFSASCYHRELEPFMKRGRDLRKQGKTAQEIFNLREQEVKSGQLALPKQPTTLFVFSANKNDFDSTSGEVKNGYLRSVIYIPFATSESTGLPLKPAAPGLPWIMHPGTHGAHIMINPPVQEPNKKQ